MLSRTKNTFSELSKHSKINLLIIAGLVLGGVLTAAAGSSPAPPQKPKKDPPAQVLSASSEPLLQNRTVTVVEDTPFAVATVYDAHLANGTTVVKTAGINGLRTVTYNLVFFNGKQVIKQQLKEEITKAPVSEVTAVGTKGKPANTAPNTSPTPTTSNPATISPSSCYLKPHSVYIKRFNKCVILH